MQNKVLFVDDEPAVLDSIRRFCHKKEFLPFYCASPLEALELIKREKFSVIVTDMRMPNMDGAELLKRSIQFDVNPIKIVLTGYADMEATQRAINEGNVYKYLNKPLDGKSLIKIVEDSISFYNEKLKQQDRLLKLGEFVSQIIHDIRNPLCGIKGSAEILMELFENTETAAEFCKIIIEQSDVLSEMAQELLEYASRPEDPQFADEKIMKVNEIINKWLSRWQQQLEQREIILESSIDCDADVKIIPNRLIRAMNNLIKNALDIKNVTHLKLSIKKINDSLVGIEFSDNGGGIPEEIISKIFDSFFSHGKTHGTGLGLSNAKNFIEQFKGTISVSNLEWEHGKGAHFEISLPIYNAEE